MGLKLSNNAVGRLAVGIAAGDLSLSVLPGQGALFPTLGAGDYFPGTLVRASDGAVEIITVTARSTDVFTITRSQENTTALAFIAGDRIELRLTAETVMGITAAATHAATSKTMPVDADELPLIDSAASNALKKLTWANLKAGIWSAWGALINGGTAKTTPVDADAFAMMDSEASNATKKTTWANIKSTLWTAWGALINGGTEKTTPADADAIALMDSAASNATKKLTIANLIAKIIATANSWSKTQTSTPSALTHNTGWDASAIQNATVNVNGSAFTIANPSTNCATGSYIAIEVTYTTTHSIAWGNKYKNVATITPSATAGKYDVFFFRYDGTNYDCTGYALDYRKA